MKGKNETLRGSGGRLSWTRCCSVCLHTRLGTIPLKCASLSMKLVEIFRPILNVEVSSELCNNFLIKMGNSCGTNFWFAVI